MVIVKCILMQKNEVKLLEPWLRYHGYMFGYENLIVIDNGSENERVIEILSIYEKVGCRIIRTHATYQSFLDKGDIVRDVILDLDKSERYDLAIPIDCDEFLGFYYKGRPCLRRSKLHEYLATLKDVRQTMMIYDHMMNVPSKGGLFDLWHIPKVVLARGTAVYLDNGYHHPGTIHSHNGVHRTSLLFLHLHNRTYEEIISYSKQKLRNYGLNVEDQDAIRLYNGNCNHLVPYFFMNEDDYISQFNGRPLVAIPESAEIFDALGINIEDTIHNAQCLMRTRCTTILTQDKKYVDLNPEVYLRRYPDVAAANIGATFHFCRYGYAEGRIAGE